MKHQPLQGFLQGMKYFSHNITIIINTLLLIPAYLIGIGFTAIIAKLVGKHFLDRKLSSEKSYWSDLHLKKKPLAEYYRQF